MPNQELHTLSTHAEVAAAALGSVYAANELGKALADHHEEATDHYLKATVGAAVAVGAYHQLPKKADRRRKQGADSMSSSDDGMQHPCQSPSDHHNDHHHPHHRRHLLEEAAGAYSLGKELLGDKEHHVAHLIAEAMGAAGMIRDIRYRQQEITDK